MGYEATRETIMAYTRGGTESYGHDRTQLAEDAVFTLMSTGKAFQGRAEVEKLLDLFYGQAFEGRDEIQTIIVEETHAVVEALFMAKHIRRKQGQGRPSLPGRRYVAQPTHVREGAQVGARAQSS